MSGSIVDAVFGSTANLDMARAALAAARRMHEPTASLQQPLLGPYLASRGSSPNKGKTDSDSVDKAKSQNAPFGVLSGASKTKFQPPLQPSGGQEVAWDDGMMQGLGAGRLRLTIGGLELPQHLTKASLEGKCLFVL